MTRARLAEIRLHPIKSLDAALVSESRIGPAGGLEFDRVWALFSADGRWMNGKRTAAVNGIRAEFSQDLRAVTLSADHPRTMVREFAFPADTAAAAEWFGEYFDQDIRVEYAAEGFPDDTARNGPMVISTASLQAVCDWFPEVTIEEARRRFRTPLEIDGVPAFWEDRLYTATEDDPVSFRIGAATFEGTNPCPRCVVPTRDSHSGVDLIGFQRRFSDLRRAHLPDWACTLRRIEHFYHLGINTRVALTEAGKVLRVGDVVALD